MATVAPAFEQNLEHSTCTYCGQCVAVCPTGALTEVDHTPDVLRALADPTKTVIVQTAPAVRAALGEDVRNGTRNPCHRKNGDCIEGSRIRLCL
ncbi:MAG: 4Fe-4S binding protein [Marinilabiliales bacterium]|nr:4Fe-4S binding protein [Marinilabiliales bacterium]